MRTLCSHRPERTISVGRKRSTSSAGQFLTIRDSLRAGDIAVAVASARKRQSLLDERGTSHYRLQRDVLDLGLKDHTYNFGCPPSGTPDMLAFSDRR